MVARAPRTSARVARKRQLQVAKEGADSDTSTDSGDDAVVDASSESENESFDENASLDESHGRKRRRGGAKSTENAPAVEPQAETRFFTAFSLPDVAVADLALEWIESFEEEASTALAELVNLVLRACGCTYMAQPHDMIHEESAASTVAEISELFRQQQLHEYPFVSVNKRTRHFRANVVEFFRSIVATAHEKGALYLSPSLPPPSSLGAPLMNSVVCWLAALSACAVRPLRYVSTTILLAVQTQLCELAAGATIAVQKQQRQLNSAQNGRRVAAARVAVLQESVATSAYHRDTVLEHMGDVFQHVFVNRYRDVDPQIRRECVRSLAQWMVHYEEMFMRAEYLRYLGWLLLDPADSVRLEAVRLLLRLVRFLHGKREAMSLGFRQFVERFKDQLVNMVWKERTPYAGGSTTGTSVALLLEILLELYGLGFLADNDVDEIGLFGVFLANSETNATTTVTTKSDSRAKIETCKFLATVAADRARRELEPFMPFLADHESTHFDADENALSVLQCLKYKKLAELFEASHAHYKNTIAKMATALDLNLDQELESPVLPQKPIFILVNLLFGVMYTTPAFLGQWQGLIKYTLTDFSAITFLNKEDPDANVDDELVASLVQKIEVASLAQKHVFLSFIASAIIHILAHELPKRGTSVNTQDDLNSALPVLIRYIPQLEAYLSTAINLYTVFMSIWNSILITVPTSIARLYTNVLDISEYNAVHDKVLHYYFDMIEPDSLLQEAFDTYFSLILKNFDSSSLNDASNVATATTGGKNDRLINANIKLQIEDLLHSLATEGVDALFQNEPFDDAINSDEHSVLLSDQKIAVNRLLRVTPILQKFSQIARVININRYVSEPTFGTLDVLLDVLQKHLVSIFDFVTLMRLWPTNYTAVMVQLSGSWQCVLDFVLLSLSWKLEDLTYASGDNSAQLIDISLFLEDFNDILISIGDLFVTVGTAVKEVNEITSVSNTKMRSLVRNLVALEHTFATYYIDMLVSLRTFYDKFKDATNFKNFELFFGNEAGVGALVKGQLPEIIQEALQRVFFVHEARLAQLKGVSLDRQNDEAVNFDDFVFEAPETATSEAESPVERESDGDSLAQSDVRASTVQKEYLVWAAERVLCVYTLKIFSLIHTGAFSSAAEARIRLNSQRLNGLFREIVGVGQAPSASGVDSVAGEEL